MASGVGVLPRSGTLHSVSQRSWMRRVDFSDTCWRRELRAGNVVIPRSEGSGNKMKVRLPRSVNEEDANM